MKHTKRRRQHPQGINEDPQRWNKGETMTTGVAVSGYNQGEPESMQVTAPGFLRRIKAAAPPEYHTWLAEEQEMAILAMLVRGVLPSRNPSW